VNLAIRKTKRTLGALVDAYATGIAQGKGLRVVAKEAAQVASLQEDNRPVPRAVDEALSEDFVHASSDARLMRCCPNTAGRLLNGP
jgi:hypothetical protein